MRKDGALLRPQEVARRFAEKCIVLGIGNPLMTDDGVGIHVVRALQEQNSFTSDEVEILDGGTLGYLLIDRVSGVDSLVVVDAANMHAAPGSVKVLTGEALAAVLNDSGASSVHEAALGDLLQMMTLSGHAPRNLALVGVQPDRIEWGTELSERLAGSVETASAAVRGVVRSWLETPPC